MSLRARGILVIGGTDASLRPDKALKPVSPSSATPSIRSLLLVAPGLQAKGSSDSVVEAPAWCSPSLASLGIDIRSPTEAIAARSEGDSIRRAAREAGQVRAGDTEAKELGVAGLAESTRWDGPLALETAAAAASSKGKGTLPERDSSVSPHDRLVAKASTEQVAPLFFGVDLSGQAHRIMRQAIALHCAALHATGSGSDPVSAGGGPASTQKAGGDGAAGRATASASPGASGAAAPSPAAPAASLPPWMGACALLRYAYEGANLDDALALASDLLEVAGAALAAAGADGATGPASESGGVE